MSDDTWTPTREDMERVVQGFHDALRGRVVVCVCPNGFEGAARGATSALCPHHGNSMTLWRHANALLKRAETAENELAALREYVKAVDGAIAEQHRRILEASGVRVDAPTTGPTTPGEAQG